MGQDNDFAKALAEKHRADALANVAMLDDVATAIAAGDLDPGLRETARATAHRLHGSLGIFGLKRAGEVAGSIGKVLAAEGPIPPEKAPEVIRAVRALRTELES